MYVSFVAVNWVVMVVVCVVRGVLPMPKTLKLCLIVAVMSAFRGFTKVVDVNLVVDNFVALAT